MKLAPITLLPLLLMPVSARDKTDVLTMKNGDRITCEVKRLQGGLIEIGLDYVDGTVAVDWLKVARMESTAMFVVQLEDGTVFAANIISPESLPSAPTKFEIRPAGGVEPLTVSHEDVVGLEQASMNAWQRLNGELTLGSIYNKGNSTTQYNVVSELGYLESRWTARARYTSSLSSSTGVETTTRNQLELDASRFLSKRKNYFYTGGANILQSSVQGIERQTTIQAGLGAFLVHRNQQRLTIHGGPGWQRTRYVPDEAGQRVEDIAVFSTSMIWQLFYFKKMRISATGTAIPALSEPGRVFFRTNVSYYYKLFGKLDWNFSFYGNWDNRPPSDLSGSDYGSSTGLSYTFGNR